jgi:hypothetical protein
VINVCTPNIGNCLTDTSWHDLNAASIFNNNGASRVWSLAFTRVTTSTVYSLNGTIEDNSNIHPISVAVGVTAQDLVYAMNATLSGGSTDPNSIATLIIENIVTVYQPFSYSEPQTAIGSDIYLGASFLVTPVVMFRPNYLDHFTGRPFNASSSQDIPVSLTQTRQRYYIFQRWPIIVYCAVATLVWLACSVVLFATFVIQSPPDSPFPIVDFLSRFLATSGDDSAAPLFESLGGGDTKSIKSKFANTQVYLGNLKERARRDSKSGVAVEAEETQQRIGFTLTNDGVVALKAGEKYE